MSGKRGLVFITGFFLCHAFLARSLAVVVFVVAAVFIERSWIARGVIVVKLSGPCGSFSNDELIGEGFIAAVYAGKAPLTSGFVDWP